MPLLTICLDELSSNKSYQKPMTLVTQCGSISGTFHLPFVSTRGTRSGASFRPTPMHFAPLLYIFLRQCLAISLCLALQIPQYYAEVELCPWEELCLSK